MGNSATQRQTRKVESAVFDFMVPMTSKDCENLPCATSCPDCGRPFDGWTRSRRCRVCGEALCTSCCSLRRKWKWRAVCNFCMDSCLHDYYRRMEGGSFAGADLEEQEVRRRVRKRSGAGRFMRGFFLIEAEVGEFIRPKHADHAA